MPFLIGFCIDAGHEFFPENELSVLIFGPYCHFIVLNCVFRQAVKREWKWSCICVCASVFMVYFYFVWKCIFNLRSSTRKEINIYMKCNIDMDIRFLKVMCAHPKVNERERENAFYCLTKRRECMRKPFVYFTAVSS